MDEEATGIAYVLVAATGFGTVGIFGTIASDVGLSIPTVLGFRFATATLVLWALLALRGRASLLRGRTLGWAVLLGVCGYGAMSGFYFWALEYMTAGLVAIVLYTFPAFVVGATLVTNPGRISRSLVVALALALGGVVLIVGADPAGADPRGVLIMLGSALAYAGYVMGSERVLESADPEVLTAYVLPAAGTVFGLYGIATGAVTLPAATATTAWGVLLGLGVVGTVGPILALYAGLRRIGASRASVVSTAEPAVAVVLGAVVLAEPITASTVAGGALVLTGVIWIHRRG
ncbi:DMT family transporter [Halosolutus amylolyticus]|uniref:DMT family transporter n=1 Tax=Halosolutus amylolyticus TaxID=2932267 RepID=A0ABD5PV17_9EURY|nr:DMT family transporter [Halosolutus amylolyticus]